MKKKFLALVLTLAMVLSLLPATALATGDVTDQSQADAQVEQENEGTPSTNSDASETVTVPEAGKAAIGKKIYNSLAEAVQEAESGATIQLGKGTYSGNTAKPTEQGEGAGKSLTFIGAGTGETTWQIQATKQYGSDGWCDYSFKGSDRITFENMTVIGSVYSDGSTKANDTQGLTYINHITLKDCIFNGRADYWGYQSTTFENVIFNAPGTEASGITGGNYSLWTYTGNSYTFKNCTFNSKSGKTVNVYRHSDAGYDIVVNFEGCTFNTESHGAFLYPNPVKIDDSTLNAEHKYVINFTGNMKTNGFSPIKLTCSRLFCFGSDWKGTSNNTKKTVVNFNGTTVWQDGKMFDAKAYHNDGVTVDGVTYDNGVAGANDSLYAEGYKDNAFKYSYGEWTKNPDGTKTRTVTKTCKYCGYNETTTENAEADPIDWDVSRSKTATALNTRDWTSDVTLSLPSAEEELASDVVFVLDTSDCVGAVMDQVSDLVKQLKAAQESSGADIKVGVVAFKGSALSMFDGKLVSVKEAEQKLTQMIQAVQNVPKKEDGKPDKAAQEEVVMNYLNKDENFIYKGSNLHSGLLGAQELLKKDTAVSNTRKYVVTVTDGMTYYWNKGDDVYGVYGGSNEYRPTEANLLFYTWCGVHGIDTEGTYTLPETFSWDAYVTSAKALIEDDNGVYDVNIRKAAAKLGKDFDKVRNIDNNADLTKQSIPYISREDMTKHAHGIDQSVIACLATYQEMVNSKYKCYVVNSDYDTSTFPGLFTSKLNDLANVTGEVNFNTITKDILYAVSAGSTVTDTIGKKFDFAGIKSLTVGDKPLTMVKDGENVWYFGDGETASEANYRFKVVYDSAEGKFVWTINENVSNFAPVQLTYTVKLTTPETDPGTYGTEDLKGEKDVPADKALFTNESAVLNAKNSAGAPVKEQKFPKPSVSYTVKNSHRPGGSGGGTVTIPDDVPTGLNGKDHYAYVVGYPDGMVYPQKNITRAEVATIFFRLLTDETREANMTKSNSYNDMKDGAWYTCAVSTLSKMGIIKGYEDGSFKPDASISRAEFAAIAARFDPDGDKTPATFSDVSSHWAKDEISIAANHGWIKGYEDGSFKPDQKITRAETMTLVNRVLKRLPETKDDLHKDMKTWPDNQNESAWFYLAVQEATNSHYQNLKKDGTHEKWESMRETRDWAALEK